MKMIALVSVNTLSGTSVQFLPAGAIWRAVTYDGYGLQVWAECSDTAPQMQYQFEIKSTGIYFDDALEFVGCCIVAGYPVFLYARRLG